MRSIRHLILNSALAVGSASTLWAGDVPKSADAIRPLLVGAKAPSVELKLTDGSKADLGDIVSEQPAIIVFYRGGW